MPVYVPSYNPAPVERVYHRLPPVVTERIYSSRPSVSRVTHVTHSPVPLPRVSRVSVSRPSYTPPVTTEIRRSSYRPSHTSIRSERIVGTGLRTSHNCCNCSQPRNEYGGTIGAYSGDVSCSVCGKRYLTTTTTRHVEPLRTSYRSHVIPQVRRSYTSQVSEPVRRSIHTITRGEPVVKTIRTSARQSAYDGGSRISTGYRFHMMNSL